MHRSLTIAAITLAATIANAEITYPVDVDGTQWAVLDLDSGEVITRNRAWPVADGGPIPGLASNIVYLLQVTDTQPQYDSRVYTLTSTETVDAERNELRKTWTTARRPTEEIEVAAANREMEEVERQGIDLAREAIETRLMVGALIQFAVDGQTLPPKVRAYADRYKHKAVRLWTNRDRLNALLTAIEQGEEFDLDAGWEPAASE